MRVEETRNIILIGKTGSGKSALANCLLGEISFKEGEGSISTTKENKEIIFKRSNIRYKIVDTAGIKDTKLSEREIIEKLAEAIKMMPEGICHILFVINGKFTIDEINMFKSVKYAIFEGDVNRYITIVRTNFPSFRNEKKCEEDKNSLISEAEEIKDIIESCNGVIHVNNSIIRDVLDATDDQEKRQIISDNNSSKINREKSREILMDHLEYHFYGYNKLGIKN
jgi:GTPase Era involved in 16S rRNA processing